MLEIKYVKAGDLIPYVNNSRAHSDEQVTQVASSMKEFGFTNPILIDDSGGIIAGHGRLMAANKLGMKEVPTIVLSGLTDAQRKAYVIADNKLALNSVWDEELLKLEISALYELDFNTDLLGFDDNELSYILNGWDSDLNNIEDKEPQEPTEFKIRVSGKVIDVDAVLSTLDRAIADSGIDGVTIEKA